MKKRRESWAMGSRPRPSRPAASRSSVPWPAVGATSRSWPWNGREIRRPTSLPSLPSGLARIPSSSSRILGERGGEVTNVDRWGRRRLTYPIARQSEGYYVVVDCLADPTAVKELDRVLALADEVVRFKIVAREPASAQPIGAAAGAGGGRCRNVPASRRPSTGGRTDQGGEDDGAG